MQSTDSNTMKGKGKDEAEAPQVPDHASILHARDMAQELRERKRSIEQDMRKEEKKLKVKASFDASFWNRLSNIDQELVEATRLGRKASMLNLGYEEGNPSHEEAWQGTEDGWRISEIEVTLQRRLSHLHKQKELFAAPPSPARTLRKAFAQMFIGSARFGMDLPNSMERQKGLQAQFREEMIEVMGRAPSNPIFSENYWCPILGDYVEGVVMRAGHLFPAGATQTTMDAIFGPQEQYMWRDQQKTSQPGVRGELFRACNGIFWSRMAEDRFGKGYFLLVPDLDPNCSKAEARAWQNSPVKEYRIRVMRPEVPDMQKALKQPNPTLWREIDGRRVAWSDPQAKEKVTFRPRSRYLYWAYLVALLRNVHDKGKAGGAAKRGRQGVATSIVPGQIGQKYWGSAGAYIKKNMLMGFLEELGHAYDEDLMEAAMDPGSDDEPAELAVMIAIEDILNRNGAVEEVDENEDDDDDDDE